VSHHVLLTLIEAVASKSAGSCGGVGGAEVACNAQRIVGCKLGSCAFCNRPCKWIMMNNCIEITGVHEGQMHKAGTRALILQAKGKKDSPFGTFLHGKKQSLGSTRSIERGEAREGAEDEQGVPGAGEMSVLGG